MVNFIRKIYLLLLIAALSACAAISSDEERANNTRMVKTNIDLALGYLKRGQFDIAEIKILRALDANWEESEAHTVAALLYERMNQADKADEHYQYAIEFQPRDGAVLNNYGVFLCRQGKWQESVENFISAVKQVSYQTPYQAYENAGACARQIPDIKNAEKYLRLALAGNPKLPTALYEMAQISFGLNKNLSVRAYLQRYEQVAAHTPQSLWLGVRVENKLGDKVAADNYAKMLQRQFPDSDEFHQLLELSESPKLPASKPSRTDS